MFRAICMGLGIFLMLLGAQCAIVQQVVWRKDNAAVMGRPTADSKQIEVHHPMMFLGAGAVVIFWASNLLPPSK